jgi:hypothetical protein
VALAVGGKSLAELLQLAAAWQLYKAKVKAAIDQPTDPVNIGVSAAAKAFKVQLSPEHSAKVLLAGAAALSAFTEALMDIANRVEKVDG